MIKTKKTTKDYYTCERCKNNTLEPNGTMIPCPRGGCEARISGTVVKTTTTELIETLSPEQEKWNKENYR